MDATRKRLLYYLLLNVIVSACVTAGVLYVYDHFYRSAGQPDVVTTQPTIPASKPPQTDAAPSPTMVGADASSMQIMAVIGAGIPGSETIVLRNNSAAQLDLKDWKLQGQNNNLYTFADVSVPPGGSLQLHTGSGQDTLIDLYWGLNDPVWGSGEKATLSDPTGVVHSVYQVP